MNNNEKLEELRAKKPNLYRVACELASFERPYAVLAALEAILKAGMGEELKHEQG
ncbi:MAG: hypothetical protein HDT16_07135 [Oscillibacter sp.]|nr:hypothetical protein [Oscillibacter sp.]